MFTQKKITFDSLIRGIISVVIIIAVLFLLDRLSGVLLPFFISWLIAYLMYPMVIFYQNRLHMKNRVASILAVMLTLAIVITGACLVFVPPMIEECSRLKHLIETYFTEGYGHSAIPQAINNFLQEHISTEWLEKNLNTENIIKAAQGLAPKLWTLISTSYNVVLAIFTFFIMILYIFFILLDYEQIAEGWVRLVPARYQKPVVNLMNDVKVSMNQYFRGQSLVAFCVGILFCIGFLIIDFPLAIPLGLFIGVLNMVPYLQIVGFIPTILLAVLKAADTGESFWWIFCMALLVFAIVQMIQDGFLVPKIMGKITGLNPAIILLSLSIWGSLMGMLGMIIALPLTTLLLSYYQRYIHRKDRDFLSQSDTSGYQEDKGKRKELEKKN